MNKNQDKGFTLVELLIVIVILGILATVTVFAVRGITDQGQSNACNVEQRTLDTAIESYYAQNQADPADIAALTEGANPLLAGVPANHTFVAASAVAAGWVDSAGVATADGTVAINNGQAAFYPTALGACA